ncbi:ArnT family glycosyltransferase [Thermaerobacter litoralis]
MDATKGSKSVAIAFLAVTALALALRVGLAVYLQPVPISDFRAYWNIAVDLAHGKGYVTEAGTPSAYRPIGYPLLLSVVVRIFGEDWFYAIVVQALMGTGIVVATAWLATRLFGAGTGLAAGLLTAILPDHLLWSTVLDSEIPFMLFMLLGVGLWVPARGPAGFIPSPKRLVLSGLCLGFAALIRPVMLPAAGLFLLYVALSTLGAWRTPGTWRRILAGTAAVTLGTVLVVAPWTIRNYVALGAFIPVSTNGGVNLWQGNNPAANGAFFWPTDPAENPLLTVESQVERDRLGRRLALQWIRENPGDFVRLGFVKWRHLLTDVRTAPNFAIRKASRPVPPAVREHIVPVLRWALYVLLTLTALGLLGWLARGRAGSAAELGRTSLPALFLLYMLALHFVFPAWDRFRFPFTPFMAILAGLALSAPVEAMRRRRGRA